MENKMEEKRGGYMFFLKFCCELVYHFGSLFSGDSGSLDLLLTSPFKITAKTVLFLRKKKKIANIFFVIPISYIW